jgi:hypothetical protein
MTMAVAASLATPASSQQAITLHGAVQFNDDHAFNVAPQVRGAGKIPLTASPSTSYCIATASSG